jgi:hypothetical protein
MAKLLAGWGYWDVTKYSYGGDFRRSGTDLEIIENLGPAGKYPNKETKVRFADGSVAVIPNQGISDDGQVTASKKAAGEQKCGRCGDPITKEPYRANGKLLCSQTCYDFERRGIPVGGKKAAEMIHSDNELGQKMEPAVPGPEAGPANDELHENSHSENGASPVLDGDLHSPERANVNAIREAIETQSEMEVGVPISEKQEEVKAEEAGKSVEIDAKPGKQIIINIASKNDEAIGGEDQGKITSGHGGGMFGGTDLEGPALESWDYPAKKAAALSKTAAISIRDLKKAGREFLGRIRTAAISVLQGRDASGFQMVILMDGREYVLRGQDAEDFRREYAGISRPENKVNALVEKYLWKLQPYKPKTTPQAPSRTVPERTQVMSSKTAADTMRCPWCGAEARKETHDGTYKCTKCPWQEQQRKAASSKKADEDGGYEGWTNWSTWHVALLIDNTESVYNTKRNLAANALKKGIGIKQLAGQFSRLFRKQAEETAQFHEDNAQNARDDRGEFERKELEGYQPQTKEEGFKHRVDNLFYGIGDVQNSWEQPMGEVNWEEIAESAVESEKEELKAAGKPIPEPKSKDKLDLTEEDQKLMQEMGIKGALSVPDRHQLRIAIDTLKAPDAMVGVMGGMNKEQALQVLARHGLRWDDADYMAGGKGVKKAAEYKEAMGDVMHGMQQGGKILSILEQGPKTTGEVNRLLGGEEHSNLAYPFLKELQDRGMVKQKQMRWYIVAKDKTMADDTKPKGVVKSQTELEKEAGFNFFFPGQVLKEFYPEIQHEIVDYPNATNTPQGVQAPEMVGEPDQQNLDTMIDNAMDNIGIVEAIQLPGDVGEVEEVHTSADYSSTSPAGAMGIGRDGKPEVLEGAPLRKENDIRGLMFTDEFYGNYDSVPGSSLQVASKSAAGSNSGNDDIRGAGDLWREQFYGQYEGGPSAESILQKKAAAGTEVEQFGMFLKKVCGEIAATMTSAFKVTSRPLLDKVPGVGEVQLAQIEQPQGMSSYNIVNTGSRVKYLLDKLSDSQVQDCINDSWSQAAVWNDSPKGGYVYEVFVRAESIDTDSMIMRYKFVCGTRE